MSLAWSALVVLVLFLPGFLFFVGISLTERFTREPLKGGTLGQLGGLLLVSLLVHGSLFLLLTWDTVCTNGWIIWRCIDVEMVLDTVWLSGGRGTHDLLADVAGNIEAHSLRILGYMLVACASSTLGGVVAGLAMVSGKGRALAKHRWAYVLVPDESLRDFVQRITRDILGTREAEVVTGYFANVVSKIREGGNTLVYRGIIADYGVADDGYLSYLALEAPERCYLKLPSKLPARLDHRWHAIGSSHAETGPGSFSPETGGDHIFLVDRAEIEHVVFTSAQMSKTPEHDDLLKSQTEPATPEDANTGKGKSDSPQPK